MAVVLQQHYGFIYLTIDLKNGKGYIGQHKICNQKTLDPQYIGSGRIIRDILKGNVNNKSRFHRQILCLCENQEELDERELLAQEKEMIGIYISGHPLEKIKEAIQRQTNIN